MTVWHDNCCRFSNLWAKMHGMPIFLTKLKHYTRDSHNSKHRFSPFAVEHLAKCLTLLVWCWNWLGQVKTDELHTACGNCFKLCECETHHLSPVMMLSIWEWWHQGFSIWITPSVSSTLQGNPVASFTKKTTSMGN